MPSYFPLGGQDIFNSGIKGDRLIQGLGKGLKNRLDHVMTVSLRQHLHVQVHHSRVGKGVKELPHHLRVHLPYHGGVKDGIELQIGAAGQVNSRQNQDLIHGQDTGTIAANPPLVSQSLSDGPAQDNAGVLDGVVAVHTQVSLDLSFQVKKPVAGKALQHVIEKANAAVNFRLTGSVQIDCDFDLRLPCFAAYACDSVLSHILPP